MTAKVPKDYLRVITGQMLDLVPLTDAHIPTVVALRNSPHVRAFFDEAGETTYDTQKAFMDRYRSWPQDLYWAVCLKSGEMIGTNRLSDVDLTEKKAVKGSQTIAQAYLRAGPYALESELLLLQFAFEDLGLSYVDALIRPDNSKVISFNEKLNGRKIGTEELRGIMYDLFRIDAQDFDPAPHEELIAYFAQRKTA